MSGPKTSSYSVDYEARRRMLEQQRIEREKREEERRVQHETKVFQKNIKRINETTSAIEDVLTAILDISKKTDKTFDIVEKTRDEVTKLLEKKDSVGSTDEKNSATLHRDNDSLGKVLQKLLVLQEECEKFSEEIHRQYYDKLDVMIKRGYFLSFSPDIIHEIHNNKELKKEYEELNQLISGFDPGGLPPDYLTQFRELQDKASEITDAKAFRKFVLTMIKPFVEKCAEYRELLSEFEACLLTYQALADVYETDPIDFTPYLKSTESLRKGLALMKKQIEALEKADMQEREVAYIYFALSEAMQELGYNLCGECDIEKKGKAKCIHHQLYKMHGETYLDVHFEDDGQISMQIGKGDNVDRVPTADETTELVVDMTSFCGDYELLEKILKKKGVSTRKMHMAPPSRENAEIINVTDFGHTVKAKTVQKKTKDVKKETKDVKNRRKKRDKLKAMAIENK